MASKSIFDCDDLNQEPEREQIVYDEDWFAFGSELPADEIDDAARNAKVTEIFSKMDDRVQKKGKRKSSNPEFDEEWVFKTKKLNISTTNGNARRSITIKSKQCEEFDILKEIGHGTYGQVYKARMKNGEVIAVKRITSKLNQSNTTQNLAFIKREYDNLRELQDCVNIVKLLKTNEKKISRDDLQIDLLLEYCPHNLQKLLWRARISLKLEEIKSFLRQILLGLKYMHDKMIMHRDIKTENILMTVDGVVKIIDFGLSRKFCDPLVTISKQNYTTNVVTQWYRAPEILFGDSSYDESADIWSFGCVMGEFWHRNAILPGKNELHQIKLISELCGSMTPTAWPNIVNLKMYQSIGEMPKRERLTRLYLKNKAPFIKDNQANDLFDKLLRCDPEKRITALTALNDDFFYCSPLPVKNLKEFMSRAIQVLCS